MKLVRAWKPTSINFFDLAHADGAFGARPRPTGLNRLGFPLVGCHARLLVAALLPVLCLTLGPAVPHELAAGAGAEGDAGLVGEAAVCALPAARQRLLRVGHDVALRGRHGC